VKRRFHTISNKLAASRIFCRNLLKESHAFVFMELMHKTLQQDMQIQLESLAYTNYFIDDAYPHDDLYDHVGERLSAISKPSSRSFSVE